MVGSISPDHNDNEKECLPKNVANSGRINGLVNSDDNGIRVSFTSKHNGQMEGDRTESSDSETECVSFEESNSGNLSDTERCLYEDLPCNIMTKSQQKMNGEIVERRQNHREYSIETASDSSSTLYSEHSGKNYEKCCDLVQNGCATNDEDDEDDDDDADVNGVNRVGQCAKTYGQKKRKINGIEKVKRHAPIPQKIVSSNRIDLTDDSSNDDAPVTLKPNLNTESPEYDLRYSTESIVSIIGCSLADYGTSRTLELLNERTLYNDNKEDEETEEDSSRPPVLRRSVRLNQQENEESSPPRLRSKLKDDKKSKPKIKLFSRTKRKSKDLERRVPNVKVIFQQANKKNQRKTSKLAGQKNSTKNHLAKSDKYIVKHKTTNEQNKLSNSIGTSNGTVKSCEHVENHVAEPTKPNTPASSVNRALWGDMTDVNEDGEVDSEFMEYSSKAEIPFAVGLLPLRAALERMQATLDHQPRKTRSSTLLTKQDSNSMKRKNSPVPNSTNTKKQNTNESEVTENPSAVCHIQIRTSSSDSRPRKKSLSDDAITSVGQATGNS